MPLPTPLGCSGVLVAVVWDCLGGGRFVGGGLIFTAQKTPPRLSLVMTPNDDQVQSALAPQKLEWVTPKILLMEAGDTERRITPPNL